MLRREISQDTFDRLLDWLDPDREAAGETYEQIRRQLVKIFVCRGCALSEDLADETIDRVTNKLPEIAEGYVGNPALYFYGVAQMVHREYVRKLSRTVNPPPSPAPAADFELEYQCLDSCTKQLSQDNRDLIIAYYQEQKQAKIDSRRELARRLGIAVNALRIRAHRIRALLESCVKDCAGKSKAE